MFECGNGPKMPIVLWPKPKEPIPAEWLEILARIDRLEKRDGCSRSE